MLLEHDVSLSAHDRAARVWLHRERIEREAAALFQELGRELLLAGHTELGRRAFRAGSDEHRHAARCRELVAALGGAAPFEPARHIVLGPRELSARDRMLYAAVAVGCVTESLSCALLIVLRDSATHSRVRATIDEVLVDEIEHARIGWAILAAEASCRDVGWLAPYLPAIAAAAVDDDVRPMSGDAELAGLGVLPRAHVQALVNETWTSVIEPGLARFGIRMRPAAERLRAGA